MLMYVFIDIKRVYVLIIDIMEVSMTYKFMNGWLVKIKDIDKIKKAIQIDKATALEKLYVYGWAIRAEMNSGLNYKEAVEQLRYVLGDIFIEEVNDFAIMKAGAKYLVLDMFMLCETEELGIKSDDYYQLYDLLEGKF